jgi:hypothetical protein
MKSFSIAIASGILGLLAIAPMTPPFIAFANEVIPQKPKTTNIMDTKPTITLQNSLENLPNGTYAYKERTVPSRIDISEYFVFRKTGATVVGHFFKNRTDYWYCFRGRLQNQSLIDITVVTLIPGTYRSGYGFSKARYAFEKHDSVDLFNFNPISLEQVFSVYPKSHSDFKECLTLFENS